MSTRLEQLVPGTRVVVRVLPPAASASKAGLAADLDAALERAARQQRVSA
jgi:RNase P protein component